MKLLKTSLSVTLALIMLLSVFIAAPVSSNAASTGKTKTADPGEEKLPVTEVKVSNLTFTEGVDCFLTDEEVDGKTVHYYHYNLRPGFSATIGNVEFTSDSDGDLLYNGNYYKLEIIDEQAYNNVWKAGTYTVKAKFQDVETTFTVTIKENPVESVSFSDIKLNEGFDSRETFTDVLVDEKETRIQWNIFDYYPKFTVKFKDGKTVESDSMGYVDYKKYFFSADCFDDQAYNNEWKKGEHTVQCFVAGFESSFKVNIEDSIIDKVEIDDVTLLENVGNEPDENGNPVYSYYPKFKVYLKDGTVVDSDDTGGVTIHGKYDYLEKTDDQLTNPWSVGEHTATGKVFGAQAPIKVTVESSPVEKVEAKDLTLYKGGDDEETYYYDEEAEKGVDWKKYEYIPEYTVTLKDGTVLESDSYGDVVLNGSYYSMKTTDDQSYKTPWDVGTHKVEGTLFGKKCEFNVNVEESPVKELKVGNMEIVEYTNGRFDEDDENRPFIYDIVPSNCEAVLKDGTVITSDGNNHIKYKGKDYKVKIVTEEGQYSNPWKKGNTYKATATFMGVTSDFEIKIVDSPAKSLTVEPIELVAGWDGYEHEEMAIFYFSIPSSRFNFTVTLNDGTELKSENGCVNYKGADYYIDYDNYQDYNNEWTVGNTYTINASVLGVSAKAKVKIIDTVVESISVDDIKLKEKVDGSVVTGTSEAGVSESYFKYDVSVPSYTVTLKDGTTLKSAENGDITYNDRVYSPKYTSDQEYTNIWGTGYHKAQIEMLGAKQEYNVIVEGDTPIETIPKTEATTEAQENTTAAPEATTEPQENTTAAPEATTEPQENTTAAPEATTEPQENTTAAPEATTEAQENTTAAPEAVTTQPETSNNSDENNSSTPAKKASKTKVTLKKSKASIYVKGTVKIKATVKNGKGKTKFKSNKPKIAKVDKNGKVTGLKKGTAKITVSNHGVKKTFTVKVKNPKLKKAKKTLKRGKYYTVKIVGKKGKAKYKSSNKRIASVSKTGKIKAKRKGKATITVTTNGKIKLKFKLTVK